MIALEHIKIVQDATKIELALWDGNDENARDNILKKIKWVQDQLEILSLNDGLCDICLGTGKIKKSKCILCEGRGYFDF